MKCSTVRPTGHWRRFLIAAAVALCGFWLGELVQSRYLSSLGEAYIRLIYLVKGVTISLLLTSVLAYLTYRERKSLRRMYEQLIQSEKLAGLGQLAAGLAHELNTPLASILGYAEELEDQLKEARDGPDTAQLSHSLEVISKQTQHCIDIMQSLLNFARKTDFEVEPVDVNEVLAEASALMHRQARAKRVHIAQQIDPDLPAILADPLQLQHALLNILRNAVDAIDGKGEVLIASYQDNGSVIIRVRDSGRGIPRNHLPRIFDPFFTSKPPGMGTGLGLSICHGIVEQLGGTISISSRVGQGTEVKLTFPFGDREVGKTRDV